MQEFTAAQLEAARAANNPEELITMAKEAGIELSREQAENLLNMSSVALSEQELESVSGGATDKLQDWNWWKEVAYNAGYKHYIGAPCNKCHAVSAEGLYSWFAARTIPMGESTKNPYLIYEVIICCSCGRPEHRYDPTTDKT